ncbi:MAG TPA: LLM class flavin-dependent oxidoreductase [Solirubrobacteraceae bacterium]|nr:LLM class flavin-dependent oxidoreductase [Solirubrobacteraceae bacterium]
MIRFGISVVPAADDLERVLRLVRLADEGGLDLVGVQDHPYQRRFVDTLALLGHLLDRTERVTVFPDVANLPLRPPAVLAKHAATLDRLSGGRFELGLGAGGFWEAIRAMGGPDRTPGQSVDALREAIDVIRLVWSDERSVRYAGEHYRLDGYHPGPPPAHPIGIWLGAYRPRMLRLTGERADGWVPSLRGDLTPAALGELDRQVSEAAAAAGRDPRDVRRIWNVMGGLRDEPGRFAEELVRWATDHGADTFVLWPDGEDQEGQVERLAAEVAPAVREGMGAR